MPSEIVKSDLKIIKIYNPFERHKRIIETCPYLSQTVEDIIKPLYEEYASHKRCEKDFALAANHIVVSINGCILPQTCWKDVIPQKGDSLVISPLIGKGQNEKLVLGIVLMIITFGIVGPAYAAASLAMAAGTSTTLLGIAYYGGMMAGGMLIAGGLSPKPKTPAVDMIESEDSQTYGWNPSTLQRQGISKPRYYGRNRLYGNIINTFTEVTATTSNIQRLKTQIGLCTGPIKGVLAVPDQNYIPQGTIALFGYCAANVYIDDVLVESLNGESLLADDFDDGDVNDWTLVNDCGVGSPTFTNSSLTGKLTANIPTASQPKSSDVEEKGAFAYHNLGFNWVDYVLTCKIKIVDDQRACHGIMFRYIDQQNYYRFSVDGRNDRIRLVRVKNGEASVLYTETYTDDNYNDWMNVSIRCEGAHITITYGEGVSIDIVDEDIEGLEINEQPASNFPGLMFKEAKGLLKQEAMEGFEQTVLELVPNYLIPSIKTKTYQTLDNDFDDMSIDLAFPYGLYAAPSGSLNEYTVAVKIEIKKSTEKDNEYLTITKSDENITDNSPSKVIRTYDSLRRKVTGITKANPGVVTVDDITGLVNGDTVIFTEVVAMPELENEEHTIANINTGAKTFEIGNTSTYTAAATGGVCSKDLVHIIERGNYYDIKITKITPDKNNVKYGDKLYLDRFREIYDIGLKYKRLAVVGVNAVATDELNNNFGFSVEADCLITRVFDYNAPVGVDPWCVKYNKNPAWVLFDLLTQPVLSGSQEYEAGETVDDPFTVERYECLNPSRLDLDKFVEFAQFCDREIDNPDRINIVHISNDVEAVIRTLTEHGLQIGEEVSIADADDSGMTEFENGNYKVMSIIDNYQFTINYDTSGFSPYYKTGTLLHFEGVDEATTAEDSGPNNFPVTLVGILAGIAKIDSAQKKWGDTSLYLNGGILCYAYVAPESTCKFLNSLSGKWTFEAWVKREDLTGTDIIMVFAGNAIGINGSTSGVTTTNWTHVSWIFVGNGTIVKYGKYVNGVQTAYAEFDVDDLNTSWWGYNFHVGHSSSPFKGWIDEVRTIADNPYNANPNVGLTDTITPPTGAFSSDEEHYGTVAKVKRFIEFNGGWDNETTVWEAAMELCRTCRCMLIPIGTRYTLVIDKKEDEPTFMFSVGSMVKDSFRQMFLAQEDRAAEIEVNYRDSKRKYEKAQYTVFNTNIENPDNKISLDLIGITDAQQAEFLGNYFLKRNQLLKKACRFSMDIDALPCTVGEVVYVQSDITNFDVVEGINKEGGGGCVYTAVLVEGNTEIIINRALNIPAPELWGTDVYQIMIRNRSTSAPEIKTIIDYDSETNKVTVSGEFAELPLEGDIFAVGLQSLIADIYRIDHFEIDSDMKIIVQAIEYNETLYDEDPEE